MDLRHIFLLNQASSNDFRMNVYDDVDIFIRYYRSKASNNPCRLSFRQLSSDKFDWWWLVCESQNASFITCPYMKQQFHGIFDHWAVASMCLHLDNDFVASSWWRFLTLFRKTRSQKFHKLKCESHFSNENRFKN